ncbi:hypothetical protein BGZ70_005781, partial [Mortierella alpina]
SPHIDQPLNAAWVRKSAHKGSDFTERECQVVAEIGNFLRPYVPKKRTKVDGDGTVESLPHLLLRAPLVRIANRILRLTGYPQFTRSISPQPSASSVQGLQLGCQGLLEALCSSNEGQFDVIRADGSLIESGAGTKADKNDVFGAFFDLDKVEDLCRQGGLQFAHRITFVDRNTIRVTGKVVPHGPHRTGYPVRSAYETRKKLQKGRTNRSWRQEFLDTGLSKAEVDERSEAAAAFCSSLEANVKEMRKELARLERIRTEARLEHKASERNVSSGNEHPLLPPPLPPPPPAPSPHSSTYAALKAARIAARDEWKRIAPHEESLRQARQAKYFWAKVKDAAKDGVRATAKKETKKDDERTKATWEQHAVEDSAERLD